MSYKPFDKSLFEKYDVLAREAMLRHLGSRYSNNPDTYGPDLIFDNGTTYVECEVKRAWKGPDYPYENINLPGRKGKWMDLDIKYYILNHDITHAAVITAAQLRDSDMVNIPNRYNPDGEMFFQFDIDQIKVVKLRRQVQRFDSSAELDWDLCVKTKPTQCKQIMSSFHVKTGNGILLGRAGDYLMKDAKGNLYVCKQEVFDAGYTIDTGVQSGAPTDPATGLPLVGRS